MALWGLPCRTGSSLYRHDAMGHGDQPPLHAEVQVAVGSMMILISMEIFMTILPAFSSGRMGLKGIIFLASKMVLSAVMKLNYLAPKELARRRIGTRLLPVIIHGDIAVKTTTCTRRNTMYCLHQSVQVSPLMMEKKRPIVQWLLFWEGWLLTQVKKLPINKHSIRKRILLHLILIGIRPWKCQHRLHLVLPDLSKGQYHHNDGRLEYLPRIL